MMTQRFDAKVSRIMLIMALLYVILLTALNFAYSHYWESIVMYSPALPFVFLLLFMIFGPSILILFLVAQIFKILWNFKLKSLSIRDNVQKLALKLIIIFLLLEYNGWIFDKINNFPNM